MPASSGLLQYVGEVNGPLLLALQSPTGPDAAARFTVSGTYAGAALVFEKVNTLAEYTAGSWTPLASVVRQDTFNVLANGVATGLTNLTLDFVAPVLYGLYAIRARLTAIASGAVAIQGVTTSRPLTDPSALMAHVALELTRIRFALGGATDLDLAGINEVGTV